MRIGTTPIHSFKLPFGVEMVEEIEIVYVQNGKEILKKWKDDCELKNNTVTVKLSQEETFDFDASAMVDIQIRVLTPAGDVLASDVIRVKCDKCLSDEVL